MGRQYTKEELHKIQEKDLEMARYFAEFCRENHLLCYLCGGGCIGAIRHGGMIPWDDDLDFFMPRRDYERMWRLWKKKNRNPRYVLEKSDASHVDHNLFVTIRDAQTTLVKPYQKDLDITHGLALDVIPLDGYPDSRWKRRLQCFWALIYSLYCAQLVPENHGKLMTLLGRLALALVPWKRVRYCLWRLAEKRMTKYAIEDCSGITELCSGPGYMRNWYPREAFADALWVPFEDTELPIPVGYDEYLWIAFGDYMELPPEEKRVAQHEGLIVDMDKSYKEYKGNYTEKKK